MKYKNKMLKFC